MATTGTRATPPRARKRAAAPKGGARTELRLAVVCYGGVSLAVYMHGITKELHKVVAASRRFDEAGDDVNPYDAGKETEHAYFEALRVLADAGRPLTTTIDVISGTSAGGINGVCLAKVLARNGSQDALKRLWINEGDLRTLLRSPPILGWRTRAAITAARTLRHLSGHWSPLRGERMSGLLYDAISEMEPARPATPPTLIRPGGSLDLFVTMTDLAGFSLLVPTGSGGVSQRETEHAQVLTFTGHPGDETFGPDSLGALAFGARATASFPGAFAPVSLPSFATELGDRAFDPASVSPHFAYSYEAMDRDPRLAWFVDGGVLDNAPFDLVIDAIARKRADSEVQRRLVYLQPDPGLPPGAIAPPPVGDGKERGYLSSAVQAVVKVKGGHTIMRELLALRDMNVRIAEIGTIAAIQMDQVNAAIEDAWHATAKGSADTGAQASGPWDITSLADVTAIAKQFYDGAPGFVGAGYTAYARLKLDATLGRLADRAAARLGYPDDSDERSLLRAALTCWGRGQVRWNPLDPDGLKQMLGTADVPYRERRLLFILAGVSALYAEAGRRPHPTRASLDGLKSEAWTLLEQLRAATERALEVDDDHPDLVPEIGELGRLISSDPSADPQKIAVDFGPDLRRLFDHYRTRLAAILGDSSSPLWQEFATKTASWGVTFRRRLLSRFIGFPLWDALIFPTIAESRLPQFTPISVSQFSPLAAHALAAPGGTKLKGISMKHFGGFADAAWRENDYLWGRLDAVELILDVIASAAPPGSPLVGHIQQLIRPGLRQVLGSETDLARVADLRKALEEQLPPSAPLPTRAG